MTVHAMNSIVTAELAHIPDWPEPQNALRMLYAAKRKHGLGKKAVRVQSREEVLQESIAFLKKDNPDWTEQFDREFFKV